MNSKSQLNKAISIEVSKFINENKEYFDSFDKIVIYYDNGQETLATILDIVFATNERAERRIEFDHIKKRLFQVSDMLTFIDKLDYKYHNNMPFTKAEKKFFKNKKKSIILGIYFEKNRNYNYKLHRLFSGMGNSRFCIAAAGFGKSRHMETVGGDFAAAGDNRVYHCLLAHGKGTNKAVSA